MNWPQDPPAQLWSQLSRERFSAPALHEDSEADAVVIGGGIAGLATALALLERGCRTILLEAAMVGAGASGRANGQVIGTLTRHGPEAIAQTLGQPFLDLVAGSADVLFGLVDRFGIDCDAVRKGWLQPAHSPGRAARAKALAAAWVHAGAPAEPLDQDQITAAIGAPGYFGGWLHRGGGHINPYAFTLGLARGVAAEGVRIHERSPALRLDRQGDHWRITTPDGQVRTHYVAVATGAYGGRLWPELARSIVPVTSYQAATEPLGPLADRILPGDHAFSDTRQDLRYMRKDREGRLVSGGALATQVGAATRLPALVRRRLALLFPEIVSRPMPHFWSGRIAMTVDRLPHLHRGDGLAAFVGCNGRGLALCCAMGGVLADAALGAPEHQLVLPPRPVSPLPFYGLVASTARMILPYYRWKDWAEVPPL